MWFLVAGCVVLAVVLAVFNRSALIHVTRMDDEAERPLPLPPAQQRSPIVHVDGLFSAGISSSIIKHLVRDHDFPLFDLSPGPVTSLHERAVIAFYMLKGGRVDFGREHSRRHDTDRFGKTYVGLHPSWDEAHPVHLIGYSLGGPTVRYLQFLLKTGFFRPHHPDSGAGWVLSLTTIQGVNNGTSALNALGMDWKTLQPRRLSPLWFVYVLVWFFQWLDVGLFNRWLNLEHWGHSRKRGFSLLDRIRHQPGRYNNAGADMSHPRMDALNDALARELPSPTTYYFAFSASSTQRISGNGHWHMPRLRMLIKGPDGVILGTLGLFIGLAGSHPLSKHRGEHGHANDGLVSVACQRHPVQEPGLNFAASALDQKNGAAGAPRSWDSWSYRSNSYIAMPATPLRGVWHNIEITAGTDDWDHFDAVLQGAKQLAFFSSLCRYLFTLDTVHRTTLAAEGDADAAAGGDGLLQRRPYSKTM